VLQFDLGFLPGVHEPAPFNWLRNGSVDPQAFCSYLTWRMPSASFSRGFVRDVRPVSDDSPFFTDLAWGVPAEFRRFLRGITVLGLVAAAAFVLYFRLRAGARRASRELVGASAYFALLGVGFMLVEIALAHKLTLYLGYPVLSLSVVLFALLVGGSGGSLLSQSWPEADLPRRVGLAAAGVVVACLALWAGLGGVLSSTLGWPVLARSALAMGLLVPLGCLLGMPFPSGLRVVGRWSTDFVPWAWAVNGIFSIVGSALAMAGGKLWGFSVVLALAALAYLLAGALGRSGATQIAEQQPTHGRRGG
jgi:hypothetical protein